VASTPISKSESARISDTPRRQLTLLDCFGLGVNGIIGSGIFLLPAALARRAGGWSPLAWLLVGGLCALVALCFAEAAGRTDHSGGPYRYACDAFGPRVGFAVGWITVVSSILGYAAVARAFAKHAALLVGREESLGAQAALAATLVAFLAVVNVLGVKPGARVGNVIGGLKLLGLFAFIAVGLFAMRAGALHLAPSPNPGESAGIGAAAFAGLFACTGFEYVPVPAGETVNASRSVGLAAVLSVLGATAIYAVVQLVAVGTDPAIGRSSTPLVDAARAFAGSGGATAVAVVALISAFGFCSGSALVCPRYLESFAQDGFLPEPLARRGQRFATPVVAILVTSLLVAPLSMTLDFNQLADTSNVAVVAQYVSTAISVLVMRRRVGPSSGFRIPFGPLVPIAAIAGCALFLSQVAKGEVYLAVILLAGGFVLALANRMFVRGV
jgi:basic amino acid/polyamine antiporter, APA family